MTNAQEYIRIQSATYETILNSVNLNSYQATETIALQVPSQ
jgi:hypothetical protein